MKTILTLDVGTTSVKTCLFNEKLEILGLSLAEYSLLTPGENRVELEAEAYWQACMQGMKQVLREAGEGCTRVSAIAVTTQGETLLPVDQEGAPLTNAIVWLDARAESQAAALRKQFDTQQFYSTTGISQMEAACPAAKVLWIRENQPEVYARTDKFLLLLDYLLFKLTGRFITDRCILSSTGYYDINNQCYWPDMLGAIGTDESQFPLAVDAGSAAAQVLDEVADELGIARGVAVVPCGMDQASSAVGAGNIDDGVITETTGTALVVAATTESPDYTNQARVNIMRHAVRGKFLILPYNSTAGMVLKWFKDKFCQQEAERSAMEGRSVYDLLGELAATVPPLCDGLLAFPHFAGMLTPLVDSTTTGVFFGVRLGTEKAHFVRAIMEGIAFMLRENIQMLKSMGINANEIRALGGGAKSSIWLQIDADVCQKTILTMENEESTSLGAAILASVACGHYDNIAAACRAVNVTKVFQPSSAAGMAYDEGYARYQELYRRLKGFF